MGWLKDAWNKVESAAQNVVEATVVVVSAPTKALIETLDGRPVDEAIQQAFAGQVGAGASVLEAAAIFESLIADTTSDVINGILGQGAEDLADDVVRLLRPLDPNLGVAGARAIEAFIETGRLELLNPVAVLLAAEIQRCRNALWGEAELVSEEVKAAMPERVRVLADSVRVIKLDHVPGALNLPKFAIRHLNRASAVTLIDVIVFEQIPGADTDSQKHYWAHELHHVHQYAEKGLIKFCTEYIGEELSPFDPVTSPPGNALEIEADYFACRYFPQAQPRYIDRCPVIRINFGEDLTAC